MFRFLNDRETFPSMMYDTKTTNRTFVDMAAKFEKMGVKNYAWHLALMQPDLQGVDPHDPDITVTQKEKIGLECRYNPWYYFREVVRIPPQGDINPVPLRANRGNLAMFWLFFAHVPIFLIQPRQTGKSVSTDTISAYVMWIGSVNTNMFLITKDHTLRKTNIDRIKAIRDALPQYLVSKGASDPNNSEELGCAARGNTYRTGVSQGDKKAADKLGRGLTVPFLHIDEAPFIRFISTTWPAAISSGNTARENAAKAGQPYGLIVTTTAGKMDDEDGRYVYDILSKAYEWNEELYDCKDEEEVHALIKANGSTSKWVNVTMSHRQLGYTDEWLIDKINTSNADSEQADRDYLNIWTSGTQGSPLTPAQNKRVLESEMEVQSHEVHPDGMYVLRKYFSEEEFEEVLSKTHVAIGLDTSDAVGRDGIGMVWTNLYDMSTVAASTVNETNILSYAMWVVSLLVRYPNTTLVIENRSSGQSIIDIICRLLHNRGIDPFTRIFNRVVDEYQDDKNRFEEIQKPLVSRTWDWYNKYKGLFGYKTGAGAHSRAMLYGNVLQEAAKRSVDKIRDKKLSGEIRGLVTKDGRIDHATASNDDMVVSWLLTQWFASHGRGLFYYGIGEHILMRSVTIDGKVLNASEVRKRDKQTKIVEEIEQLQADMKREFNVTLRSQMEHRVKFLSTQIEEVDVAAESMDQLMRETQEGTVSKMRQGLGVRKPLNGINLGSMGRRVQQGNVNYA